MSLTYTLINNTEYKVTKCDTSATEVVIPSMYEEKKVTSIGDYAFQNCSKLTSIEIPDSVTSIGVGVFRNCSKLISIVIPDSVTSIGYGSFEGCSKLISIVIPDSVTSIGSSMFYNCSSLTSIEIPNSVTSIGGAAFYKCSSLTEIVIPNSVSSIGKNAFSGCSSLTIYSKSESQPSSWDQSWNPSERPVYWYSEEKPNTEGNYWHYTTIEGFKISANENENMIDSKYFKVTQDGTVYATNANISGHISANSGDVGGFNISDNSLSTGVGNSFVGLRSADDPRTYTPAEYIESNGNQYIDTGVVMDYETDAFEITVQPTVANQNGMIFGRWNNAQNEAALYHYKDISEVRFYAYSSELGTQINAASGISTTDLTKHTYKIINNQLFVDGNLKASLSSPVSKSTFTSFICAANGLNAARYSGKIYGCKIWRNGDLIRNLIPAFKDGEYGLYDNCFGQFYKNQNNGYRFSGSLNTEDTDILNFNGESYTRLEYIQNNGKNDPTNDNYIELPSLNISKRKTLVVEVEYEPTGKTSGDDRCCLLSNYSESNGVSGGSNLSLEIHQTDELARAWIDQSERLMVDSKEGVSGTIINQKNKVIYTYTTGTISCSVNDKTTVTKTLPTLSGDTWTGPFRIFVDNYKGGRFDKFDIPLKLYSLKIYSGSSKIIHLLPVKNSNGVAGVIDLVSGNFYTTPSGSPFTYGNYDPKTGNIFSDGQDSYRTLSYIESDDNSYINTGVCSNYNSTTKTVIEVDAMALSNKSIYGTDQTSTSNGYNYTVGGSQGYFYYYGSAALGKTTYSVIGVREVLKQDGPYCYRNGELVATASDTTADKSSTLPILLSARSNPSTVYNDNGPCRIYSCKIWENGALIRDFIPVIKNEAEYGLYDLVNKTFYGNANSSGKFIGKGYTSEFTSLYLGAVEPELAPFSVTNTGKLKASNVVLSGNGNSSENLIDSQYFKVSQDGSAEAINITLKGNIDSSKNLIDSDNFKVSQSGDFIAKRGKIADEIEINKSGLFLQDMTDKKITFGNSFYLGFDESEKKGTIHAVGPVVISGGPSQTKIDLNSSYLEKERITFKAQMQVRYDAVYLTPITVTARTLYINLSSTEPIPQDITFNIKAYMWKSSSGTYDKAIKTDTASVTWKKGDKNTNEISITANSPNGGWQYFNGNIVTDLELSYNFDDETSTWHYVFSDIRDYKGTNTDCNPTYVDSIHHTSVSNGLSFFMFENTRQIQITGDIIPSSSDFQLGCSSNKWNALWATTGSILTSDRNEKNNINKLSDEYEKIFDGLKPVSYKLNKNSSNRTHIGFIAQDVEEAVINAGLTTQEFAGICYWNEEKDTKSYGLRYEEFIALCVDQIQKLKKQVATLEEKLNTIQNDGAE